jgi:hypothetical protein
MNQETPLLGARHIIEDAKRDVRVWLREDAFDRRN